MLRRAAVLYVREQQECMELSLGMDEKPAESWSRLMGRPMWVMLWWVSATNYLITKQMRPPSGNWKSHVNVLVLIRNLNHADICWRDNMTGTKQFR